MKEAFTTMLSLAVLWFSIAGIGVAINGEREGIVDSSGCAERIDLKDDYTHVHMFL